MRRLVSAGVVAITALALATPALTSTAAAAPGTDGPVVAAKVKAGNKIKVKKSAAGVQPGISKLVLTASNLRGSGKVKFTVTGDNGVTLKGKAKAKKGKAKYTVPALGTGHYKVKVKFKKQKGKTKFEVYDSALTLNTTALTCSISNSSNRTKLSGNVKYRGAPATGGYVDIYKDGNIAGGSQSPSYLAMASVNNGAFDFSTTVCSRVISGTTTIPKGVANQSYTYQAYYTKDSGFDDYFSSNLITVTVVP
ncbi:hypothetical protein [Nocardioides sp. BYT-33-1]|uniref:hypothetical protein n=1 Tax=Nocardioides sp. BYT-33-1 TaxID=3416952 RepID=UPI003F53B979